MKDFLRLLVGIQKIVLDLPAALRRIDEIAAPMRARSLHLDLPCTRDNGCVDCREPHRICRATLILHRRPLFTDITVILIGEALGMLAFLGWMWRMRVPGLSEPGETALIRHRLVVSSEKARREMGWRPRYSTASAVGTLFAGAPA